MAEQSSLHINENQINAVLDGEADRAVLDHIASCPSCTKRVTLARQIEQGLKGAMYRQGCLTPDQLTDYEMQLVSPHERLAIIDHLRYCRHCKAEFEATRAFLDSEPRPAIAALTNQPQSLQTAATQLLQVPTVYIGQLVTKPFSQTPQPLYRATQDISRKYTVVEDDFTLLLRVEIMLDALEIAGRLEVRPETGVSRDDLERWDGAVVQLLRQGLVVASTVVDAAGSFTCALTEETFPREPFELQLSTSHDQLLLVVVDPRPGTSA